MRSVSTFVKLTFIVLAAALVSLSAFSKAPVEAAQATEASTPAATSATKTFPPCPPVSAAATESAATAEASTAATSAATPNANPAYLGVTAEQVDSCGVRVVEVKVNSPASQGGLQADDVIVALDGQATPDINLLRDWIRAHVPGDKVTLTVQRNSQQVDVVVTLGAVPADTTGTVESGGAATPAATQ
jgi:predicted metalloprotease with PDZ domain